MEIISKQKNKSFLEKIAPLILVFGIIFLAYFVFQKYKPANTDVGGAVPSNPVGTTQIQVDTTFLTSEKFTSLQFIPDSSIFNEVPEYNNTGKDDPFAP